MTCAQQPRILVAQDQAPPSAWDTSCLPTGLLIRTFRPLQTLPKEALHAPGGVEPSPSPHLTPPPRGSRLAHTSPPPPPPNVLSFQVPCLCFRDPDSRRHLKWCPGPSLLRGLSAHPSLRPPHPLSTHSCPPVFPKGQCDHVPASSGSGGVGHPYPPPTHHPLRRFLTLLATAAQSFISPSASRLPPPRPPHPCSRLDCQPLGDSARPRVPAAGGAPAMLVLQMFTE